MSKAARPDPPPHLGPTPQWSTGFFTRGPTQTRPAGRVSEVDQGGISPPALKPRCPRLRARPCTPLLSPYHDSPSSLAPVGSPALPARIASSRQRPLRLPACPQALSPGAAGLHKGARASGKKDVDGRAFERR